MRILHTGDWHINVNAKRLGRMESVYGRNPVHDNRLAILNYVIDTGLKEKVDMFVIAGDIFDIERPFPEDYYALNQLLDKIPDDVLVFIINGNHDNITSKGCALEQLRGRRKNILVGLEAVSLLLKNSYNLIMAPWGTSLDKIKTLIDTRKYPAILMFHAGVVDQNHEWLELEGDQGNVHLNNLKALGCKAIMLSHHHNQVELAPNIWYAGSPDNVHGFSEEKDTKGFLIWEIGQGIGVTAYSTETLVPKYVTLSVPDFLEIASSFDDGYIRVKGEVTEKQRLDVINKMKTFDCMDYKLDLTSKLSKKKVTALRGNSDQEILTNYFLGKKVLNLEELVKLDKEVNQ